MTGTFSDYRSEMNVDRPGNIRLYGKCLMVQTKVHKEWVKRSFNHV